MRGALSRKKSGNQSSKSQYRCSTNKGERIIALHATCIARVCQPEEDSQVSPLKVFASFESRSDSLKKRRASFQLARLSGKGEGISLPLDKFDGYGFTLTWPVAAGFELSLPSKLT